MTDVAFKLPEIGQADFHAFHAAHFSKPATDHFLSNFLRPDQTADHKHAPCIAEEESFEDEEDDGLGYYDDGVKRTLTDDEIAFLRHSELQALRRAQEKKITNKVSPGSAASTTDDQRVGEGQLSEEGELSSGPLPAAPPKKRKKKNNKPRRKGASYRDATGELIDLRKRTWDVVDKGLTTLAYDEEADAPGQSMASQRQRISYDD